VLKRAVCTPAQHHTAVRVKGGEVALEGNVALHHVNACTHAFKGAAATVMPAGGEQTLNAYASAA
jgi:hypothetical protein